MKTNKLENRMEAMRVSRQRKSCWQLVIKHKNKAKYLKKKQHSSVRMMKTREQPEGASRYWTMNSWPCLLQTVLKSTRIKRAVNQTDSVIRGQLYESSKCSKMIPCMRRLRHSSLRSDTQSTSLLNVKDIKLDPKTISHQGSVAATIPICTYKEG